VWKWPVVKYKHIKIKPRICVLFILRLTWTVNANLLKQNIVVIKEICSWLPLFCKQVKISSYSSRQTGSQEHTSLMTNVLFSGVLCQSPDVKLCGRIKTKNKKKTNKLRINLNMLPRVKNNNDNKRICIAS